jgi:tetratricopeptide (TPR) repeat protein
MAKSWFFRGVMVCFGFSLSFSSIPMSGAQTPFQNPLQVEEFDDPLLPQTQVIRPLSPLEKFRLEEALDQLNQEAIEVYQQGNVEQAFQIWYRELRLRQKLDTIQEVRALGRVGEVAWSENRSQDFRNIQERLQEIEETAKANNNQDLIRELAEAHEKMRETEGAIALYEILLENSPNPNPLLEKIASLYQSQFNYQQAASTYETLLAKAQAENNTVARINYIETLKDLYEQAENYQQAIQVKQRLRGIYQQQNNQQALPALIVSLGDDYRQTQQLDQASESYQEAFRLAWSQQKYAIASDALENLAQLYRNDGNLETTLDIYEQLLIVQEQSYDHYGLMMTYNKIGEIYQQRNQQQQALTAYENALRLAQSISYQEDYFQNKIESLKS